MQDQQVGSEQAVDLALQIGSKARCAGGMRLFGTHVQPGRISTRSKVTAARHRIEALRVEIRNSDLMPGTRQGGNGQVFHRAIEGVRLGVCVDDQDVHGLSICR